jgi:hypothetical protein
VQVRTTDLDERLEERLDRLGSGGFRGRRSDHLGDDRVVGAGRLLVLDVSGSHEGGFDVLKFHL